MIDGRMILYRINDGAWFPLARSGGTSARYGWFYNYKEFLEINRANEAKQN